MRKRLCRRKIIVVTWALAATQMGVGILGGGAALTDDKIANIEIELTIAATPEEAFRILKPHLQVPDPRLAPSIAGVLSRGEELAAATQDALYQALAPVADKRVYEPAVKMTASAESGLAPIGIRLLGKSGHPKAPETLIAFYRKTDKLELRPLVLEALGGLKDASARPFVQQVLQNAEDLDVRDEAVIAAVCLGMEVEPLAFLQANAHMKDTIQELSRDLSYTKRAHPKEYVLRIRRLKELDDRLSRLVPLLKAVCVEKAEAVCRQAQSDETLSLAENFAPYVSILADRLPPDTLLPLLRHKSDALAAEVAKALWTKGEPSQAAVKRILEELAKDADNARRERADLLARVLPVGTAGKTAFKTGPAGPTPAADEGKGNGQPAFQFLLWDGGRFGSTPELMERDIRYYKDLGFTHFQSRAGLYVKEVSEQQRQLFDLIAKYDMLIGLYYAWDFSGLNESWEQLAEKGMTLNQERKGDVNDFNPLHPDVVRYWSEGALRTLDTYRSLAAFNRIKTILIGSETTWGLPKPDQLNPNTVKVILDAARADGVLGPGESDWEKLGNWWGDSRGKGRDYRLRKAFEDELLKRIPDAECWVDPIWAIKIVHGFGGTWTYVSDDPKRIAAAVVRLKAMCHPSPCMHGTQLTRGSGGGLIPHDHLMEANLLSLCMGADKLYHWGLNSFEPGREASPAYGSKDWKPSPPGFPSFQADHVKPADWPRLVKLVYEGRKEGAYQRLWDLLGPKLRERIEEEAILTDVMDETGNGKSGPDKALREMLLNAFNAALRNPNFYDAQAFQAVTLTNRAQELISRNKAQGRLELTDLAELNRLLLEAMFASKPPVAGQPVEPYAIPPTPEPNLLMLREKVRRIRQSEEPAVRSTGRLLRDRGALFRDWKPLEPRLALLGGIYGEAGPFMALIVGHVPFDLLRSPDHRRARLAAYRFVALLGNQAAAEDYADLLKIDQAGGVIFVPAGFQPPAGRPALKNAVVWDPDLGGKAKGKPRELRETQRAQASAARALFHQAGLLPYFDTDNLDLVLQGFTHQDHPMLFVVNDKRGSSDPERSDLENKGLPNAAEFLIREQGELARVIDIDTGAELKLTRADNAWRFRDTIPPAWYKIYAVLKKGAPWNGPEPLPGGPAIQELTAARDKAPDGVRLTWKLPFDDWVGCDVGHYRIYRAEGKTQSALLAEIPGRILTGPGGVVTSYLDSTVGAGGDYTYQVRAVTPLHREGPMSQPVKAESR